MLEMLRKREFWSHLMTAVAGAASFATLITFLFGWNSSGNNTCNIGGAITLTVFVLVICFVYAVAMCWQVKRIDIEISKNFKLTIEEGNLLDRNLTGVIVIPVNSCFNPQIVNRKESVFKSFIDSLWKDRLQRLKNSILEGLQSVTAATGIEPDAALNRNYPLGTCIQIMDGGNVYVLVAAAEKDANNASTLKCSDYPKVIEGLFNYLGSGNFNSKIYLPLLGTGHGRLKKSPRRALYFMLDAIEFKHNALTFPQGVCIKLKSLQTSGINLNDIKRDFRLNLQDK